MPLIKCWECETEISSAAAACPKCGAPSRPAPAAPDEAKEALGKPPAPVPVEAPPPVPAQPPAKRPMGKARLAFNIAGAVFLVGIVACGGWYFLMPASFKGITRAVAPSVTPEPVTRYNKTLSIDEDKYQYVELAMNSGGEVRVDVRVASGPAIDVYFMDMASFGEWKKAVSKVFGGQFHFIPQLSSGNTRSFHGGGLVKPGQYVLVMDNTDYGDAHPPMNMANDVATVECKIQTD